MLLRLKNLAGTDSGELFVRNGRFAEPGAADREVDIGGRWALPGLIDSHCHILPTGLDLLKLNLSGCAGRTDVLDAVRDRHRSQPEGWLHATHYDQNKFEGREHLTRDDLDAISADRPILLRHSNGHASVANSAALRAAGIDDSTENPKGGEFVKDGAGHLTGVLLETAHEKVTSSAPDPNLEEMVEAILRAGELMHSMGITCASDMMTGRWDLEREIEAYRLAAERGCQVRTRLYLQWRPAIGPRGAGRERLTELAGSLPQERCRIVGLKIFADGAIGSATAAIHGRFLSTGGQGTLIYSPERLKSMVQQAHDLGWPVAIHSIGDRSTDLVMDAIEETDDPSRHRIEHVMILSDAQIERIARLGCPVTLQPEFLQFFGHAYLAQLGPEITSLLNRGASLLAAGIPTAFNTDRPIVPGHPADSIEMATCRPEGFCSSENVTLEQAVEGWTKTAARVNGDAGELGELKPGCLADLVLFDSEPKSASALANPEVWDSSSAV
jgi:predicted amidohydrolase YtcJ